MNQLLKKLAVYTSVISLINLNPIIISDAFAAKSERLSEVENQSNSSINNLLGIFDQTMATFTQMQQQAMANQNAMSMMQQIQAYKPTVYPSKYFPQCKVPAAVPATPQNMCENIKNDMSATVATQIITLAQQYKDAYDKMLSRGQTSQYPIGMQCIEEYAKHQDTILQDKINQLTAAQAEVNKQMQAMRDVNKKITEDMAQIDSELNGKKNGEASIEEKGRDLSKYFAGTPCTQVLNASMQKSENGLREIKKSMSEAKNGEKSLVDLANQLVANEGKIRDQISRQLGRLGSFIQANGITNPNQVPRLFEGSGYDQSKFEGIINTHLSALVAKQQNLNSKMAGLDLGQVIPEVNSINFRQSLTDFSPDDLKDGIIAKCISGDSSNSLGMKFSALIKGVKLGGSGRGTMVENYRKELKLILNRGSSLEDTLADLQKLDRSYNYKMQIQLDTITEGIHNISVSDYYTETAKRCSNQYNRSYADKVSKAREYIHDIANEYDSLMNNITADVSAELLDCSKSTSNMSGSCNEKLLDTSSSSFCLASAKTCAVNINQCMAKVESVIKDRENLIKVKALAFNRNVESLLAAQEQYLKVLKAQVGVDMDWFKQYFPGANYNLLSDLFVAMPAMEKKYGAELRGGGDMEELLNGENSLPRQIDKLKEMLAEQKGKIQTEINDYMQAKEESIRTNQATYQAILTECKGKYDTYVAGKERMMQQMQQQQQEMLGKATKFCQKYDLLTRGNDPGPLCDGSFSPTDLLSDSTEVVSYINPDALDMLVEIKGICNQREKDDGELADMKEEDSSYVAQLCDKYEAWETVKEKMEARIKKIKDEESKDEIKKIMEDISEKEEDVNNDVKKIDVKEGVYATDPKNIIEEAKEQENENDVCKQYQALQIATNEIDNSCSAASDKTECQMKNLDRKKPSNEHIKEINNGLYKILLETDSSQLGISSIGEKDEEINVPYCWAFNANGRQYSDSSDPWGLRNSKLDAIIDSTLNRK
ncbi:MAG: hypothetical protein A2504_13820 [Bdellovibrionales bacterium RIFOXYD12_FULL_39_22]|nr:MAG: hypothetical protein A2385_00545 [Bdellovibrionales bacterium RIFOXYB1_FULL_39_21]OFZ43834.1 MAG: hypothetical protein A2485_04985 [Bdellovibrionales bacterium RIFOXYC12_FULL_39_17]OFZ48832.1 MAG: hypothetical protein A2404_17860 [Bdellovibrionales bacterium RIFOXYC1_FULL_39_130]OFZ76565.1 MAG: hypothetical protein A2560_06525 [Bdellovibrionales bacterium RIFOXYD1_FULL_39_84]OFZ94799.1 MAG: hypothetical protein A2504_13820 [Bdellovibrionales bacterium RIFOXYD12_FULL_39_22]HLE12223.1 hy